MTTKTKRRALSIVGSLGTNVGYFVFFRLGLAAGSNTTTFMTFAWFAFLFFGTGTAVLAHAAEAKLRKMNAPEAPSTGDPYRDASNAVQARIVELEKELAEEREEASKVQRPFPLGYVAVGAIGGVLLLFLAVGASAAVSSCTSLVFNTPDAGIPITTR